jgi:transcriptional regulator with XRE-family HTH domain
LNFSSPYAKERGHFWGITTMLTPFGKAIRQIRNEKGLRLLDLAEKLGFSAAFVSGVETGRKPIPDGYVTAISRALKLSAPEIQMLRRAADRTRKQVRVAQLPEEKRELVAAFARQLDDVPDELITRLKRIVLKSLSGENPFKRQRLGIIVPPRSARWLRSYAEKVRSVFCEEGQIEFPIIDVLEKRMAKAFPEFFLDVVEKEVMGEHEGRVTAGQNGLSLREDVYIGACRGVGRHRFTACHELGHFLLHSEVTMARTRDHGVAIYRDSEWQADTFSGALMMSARHLTMFSNEEDAARKCRMSTAAAQHQWNIYRKEGQC